MKRRFFVITYRWIIPIAFVFICIFLPDFGYLVKIGIINPPPFLQRILFSIFLSYPFLSAATILSKLTESNRQDYEKFFIKVGNKYPLENSFARFPFIVGVSLVMLFTLQIFFSFPGIAKWPITIIFMISVAMLNWNIDNYLKFKD